MTDFQYRMFNPFGPNILVAKCPDFILDEINKFIESSKAEPVSEDLLDRDIDVVYLTEQFCEHTQLKHYLGSLGELYK